jgi:hypothetical protein
MILIDDVSEHAIRPRPLDIGGAAQAGRGKARVDGDLLAPAGLELPDVGHRDADGGNRLKRRSQRS